MMADSQKFRHLNLLTSSKRYCNKCSQIVITEQYRKYNTELTTIIGKGGGNGAVL